MSARDYLTCELTGEWPHEEPRQLTDDELDEMSLLATIPAVECETCGWLVTNVNDASGMCESCWRGLQPT